MLDAASEIARLRDALAASEARVATAESELAQARAVVSTSEAMIKHLKLEIAKLRREQYGHGSERRARLIDQMELQLEELEAAATEDEIAAEKGDEDNPSRRLPASTPGPQALSGAPAARARGDRGSDRMFLLRLGPSREDGRGRRAIVRHWSKNNGERNAGGDPSAVEGDPDRPREVHLPPLRDDFAAAIRHRARTDGARWLIVPCHPAGMGRPEPSGHNPVREVRTASAAQSSD